MAPGIKRISTLFRSKSKKHPTDRLQTLPDEPEDHPVPLASPGMLSAGMTSPSTFLDEFDRPITDRVIVVAGASRGLGLEFVKQFSKNPRVLVIAIIRNPETAARLVPLTSTQVVAVHADVTDQATLRNAVADVARISGGRVDLLINNAAINEDPDRPLAEWDADPLNAHLETNVTGPVITTNAFLPLLRKGKEKRVINMTTGMSSLAYNDPSQEFTQSYSAYSISKAALNLATRKYAVEHAKEGFTFVALSAGWVSTDMGGPKAPLSPPEAVSQLLKIINGLTPKDNGKFLHIDGTEIEF